MKWERERKSLWLAMLDHAPWKALLSPRALAHALHGNEPALHCSTRPRNTLSVVVTAH